MSQPVRTLDFGLALGGGGAKGLSHLPFLAALEDMGVRPAIISGTSMGAIIGGLYAAGLSTREIVTRMEGYDVYQAAWRGLVAGFDEALTSGFLRLNLPVSDFSELQIPAIFVASDYWTRDEVAMSDGDLYSAIYASAALPGLNMPVARDGRTLIDGACVNPVPFDLLQGRATYIAAVNVAGVIDPQVPGYAPDRTNAVFVSFQIMQKTIVAEKLRRVPVDFLAQPELLNVQPLDFEKAEHIIESASGDVARFRLWIETLIEAGAFVGD